MTDAEDFAQRWSDAWNAHDADAVIALYAVEGTHRMSSGPLREGRAEVLAMVERSLSAYPDLGFHVRGAFAERGADGNRVVIEYTMRGTQTGAINGREGSGRPIDVDGAIVVMLDDSGAIRRAVDYIDHHAIRVQQGDAD